MARPTPATLTGAYRGEAPQPVYLIELNNGAGTTHRMCSGDGDVEFGGHTWGHWALEWDEQAVDGHEESPGTKLHLADAAGWWRAQESAGAAWTGQRVRVIRTDRAALEGAVDESRSQRDTYRIESWERAQGAIAITLAPMTAWLNTELPLGTITRTDFPGIPPVNAIP